ncbi:SprT family zinc-dependent metalloprotease [Geminicoccaceae bacterium 1502E]|nr:SprT family zinc-dependent metalloprotease [Geminicoccaceae bacterium 1502E]
MKRQVDDLAFCVVRSRRRTADIVVERDGQVVVRAPQTISDEAIDATVRGNAAWVHRALAEREELAAARCHRPFVQGSGFLYLGRNYRLRFVDGARRPLMLRNGWFEIDERVMADGGEPGARKVFRDFYTARALPLLEERVALFAQKIGVEPGQLVVRELGYHWASCGPSGRLNFHWKIMMAPSTVIDYVVVHELCHLRHRDHSAAFWNEVDKVLSGWRARKDWLRRYGAGLDL